MKKVALLACLLCCLAFTRAYAQIPLSQDGTIPPTILVGVFQEPAETHLPNERFVQRWIVAPYDRRQPVEQSLLGVITYPYGVTPHQVWIVGTGEQVDATHGA